VRIESGQREMRPHEAKPREFARREIDDLAKQLAGQ
jgi:hypothetical protein